MELTVDPYDETEDAGSLFVGVFSTTVNDEEPSEAWVVACREYLETPDDDGTWVDEEPLFYEELSLWT